jgi:triosephosphate isomerase
LQAVPKEQAHQVVIAYEPIWAIGTGKAATLEQIAEVHAQCKALAMDLCHGATVPILYGGSVNVHNASSILMTPAVDGLLIGSASLNVDAFATIATIDL